MTYVEDSHWLFSIGAITQEHYTGAFASISLRKASFEIMDVKDQIPRQPQCYWITILGSWRRDDDVSTTERTHGPPSTLKGIILAVTVMYYLLRV